MKTAFLRIDYKGMLADEIIAKIKHRYPWANFWIYRQDGLQCFADLHDAQLWADMQGI